MQKIVTKLSKIWVWDPGSEIRDPKKNLFRIPYPSPGVKKAPDPDLQHWFFPVECGFIGSSSNNHSDKETRGRDWRGRHKRGRDCRGSDWWRRLRRDYSFFLPNLRNIRARCHLHLHCWTNRSFTLSWIFLHWFFAHFLYISLISLGWR